MNLEEYKAYWRTSNKNKPGQDIIERWQSRIVSAGLQEMGPAGGELYLTRYGKSIASPKCIKFGRYAEAQGYKWFADWFWEKAYGIDYPDGDVPENHAQEAQGAILEQPTSSDTLSKDMEIVNEIVDELIAEEPTLGTVSDAFPFGMQPGSLVTSQPTDAKMPREFYINDERYFSQPKRDGNKLIVFSTPKKVWYQSRQLKVNGAPSIEMDQAFKQVASDLGSFILEGEIYFTDVLGKEHMTGETCRAANEMLGRPSLPDMVFSAFGCLYFGENDLTRKYQQVWDASTLMDCLAEIDPVHFSKIQTAQTREAKGRLATSQKIEGREGEVYFLKDLVMRPGKITSSRDPQYDGYVRVKNYLGVQRYRVTSVAPSKADGHFIGGFSIEDTDGNSVGTVGTGYSREDQREILRRFTENPDNTWVLVDAQTKTIYGKLRHAAFKGFADE